MITTCTKCGKLYEEQSSDEASSPNRLCVTCYHAKKESKTKGESKMKYYLICYTTHEPTGYPKHYNVCMKGSLVEWLKKKNVNKDYRFVITFANEITENEFNFAAGKGEL